MGNITFVSSPAVACVVGLTFLTSGLSSGQILQNGSFENDYTGWAGSGNQAVATNDPSHPASSGFKVVVFSPGNTFANAWLSQTFATTPGQRYRLAIDLGTVGAIADQKLGVKLEGNGVLLDQTLTVSGIDASAFYTWQYLTFVANSVSTTLSLYDASITYYVVDLLLDNVVVTTENAQAPLITSQPKSTYAVSGGSATFSVTASGPGGPLTYQWSFKGTNISGANASSYTVTGANASKAGNYGVIVTNAFGWVISSAATLTVIPPAILLNGSFEYGSAAWTFDGSVADSTNTNYGVTHGAQLVHFNYGQLPSGGTLSQTFATTVGQAYELALDVGAFSFVNQDEQRMQLTVQGNGTLISQNVSVFAPGNGTRYTPLNFVFVANSSSTTLSFHDTSPTTLNVDLVLDNIRVTMQNAPFITAQPESLNVPEGSTATFSVTAGGQAPLSYQWRKNGTNIIGANASSYGIPVVLNNDAGQYDVVVSNSSGSVTSSTAALTVGGSAGMLINGSFEFNYGGWVPAGHQAVVSGSPFQVTDGTKAIAFNVGQNTPDGVLTQIFATTIGQTYVLDFDLGAFSMANQNEQRMRVSVQGNALLVSQNLSVFAPGNGTRYLPQSFSFVADTSTTTLTFQDISTNTLNTDLLLDNVRVTAHVGPVITAQPQSLTVQTGNSATFSVTASGQAPLSYQWRRNGVTVAGATSSSYTIASAQGADAGSFDVIVSNNSGAVTSSTAVLTVVPAGILLNGSFEFDYSGWNGSGNQQIVSGSPFQASDGTKLVAFNAGQSAPNGVLTQNFATTVGQTYTLSFDAGAFSFANQNEQRIQVSVQGNSTLLSQSVSVFAPGNGTRYLPQSFSFVANSSTTTLTFRDISTNTLNTDLLLDNVRVTVQNGPVITAQPQSLTVQAGNSATFSVTASGQAPLAYQWRRNGVAIGGATSSSYTIASVQGADAGSFDVIVSNGSGAMTSSTAVLTVASAGTLNNGSFELDYSGWNGSGNQQIVSGSPFQASDGTKLVAFNAGQSAPNGVLTQSFATTVGQTYRLSFDAGAFSFVNQNEQRMQVSVQGNGTLLSQNVSVFAPGNGTRYLPQSFSFVANSSTTTLTFRDISMNTLNTDLLLDNVRVTLQSSP